MKTPKLYKNNRDGIWQISYYLDDKRERKSLGTKCEMTANLLASKLTGFPIAPVATPLDAPALQSGVSFVEAVNKFIKSKWGINDAWMYKPKPQCNKPPTLYLMILKRLQLSSKVHSIDEVTYDNLQGFISSLRESMNDRTVNKHIARLRSFLGYCVNMQYVKINEAYKLDTYKSKPPIRYSFKEGEVNMILEKSQPRFAVFFELMLETGLRACDMWNLTKDNFPSGNFIHIIQEKTGDELNVPISKRAQEIVAGLEQILFPWADRVWSKKNGEWDQRVQCRNELRKCFGGVKDDGCLDRGKTYCKPLNIRLHTFRHTFAMWKLAVDTPLAVIKDLMGHKSVRMAELYAHSMPKSALAQWV